MDERENVAFRIQRVVTEIAEVLAQRQGKTEREVWTEVLTLHRKQHNWVPEVWTRHRCTTLMAH